MTSKVEQFCAMCPEMLCIVGPDGRILLANPALGAALGYGSSELESREFGELVHEHDRRDLDAAFEAAASSGKPVVLAVRCRSRDGSYRPVEWVAQARSESAELIRQALSRTQGNQTRAAKLLNISRDALRYKMKKFELKQEGR